MTSEATPRTNEHAGFASLVQCLIARPTGGRRVAAVAIAALWIAAATVGAAQAPAARSTAPAAAEAEKHRAWLNQNCLACHNSRTAQPSNDPVNLETVSVSDLLPHAATWERVLRKLSVRAMPPQGMTPAAAGVVDGAAGAWAATAVAAAIHRVAIATAVFLMAFAPRAREARR